MRAALLELVDAQADHLRATDPVEQFLQLVPAVLASGAAHVEELGGGRPAASADLLGWQEVADGVGSQWRPRGLRVGWADATTVYLIPDAGFAEVQKAAAAQRAPITMSARTLWSRLRDRGVLLPGETRGHKTRHTSRITVGGQRLEVLRFPRSYLCPPASTTEVGEETDSGAPCHESVPSGPHDTTPGADKALHWATPGDARPGPGTGVPGSGPRPARAAGDGSVATGHSGHSPATLAWVEEEL